MARNDEFFLNKWIEYYGAQFGEENLYIFLDGKDQKFPSGAGNSNIIICEKTVCGVVKDDKRRIAFLSEQACKLMANGYDMIVGCDADEYLVVDPAEGVSLAEYLSQSKAKWCLSGLGLDVGQKLGVEAPLTAESKFLQQRSFAYICSRYTKPVVMARPGRWGSGFHRFKGHNYHIDKKLYLFHFGGSDKQMLDKRYADKERLKAGWGRHLKKRYRPTRLVSTKKNIHGENYLQAARVMQNILRPIYAMNKPSMSFVRWVVKIPERFKNVL